MQIHVRRACVRLVHGPNPEASHPPAADGYDGQFRGVGSGPCRLCGIRPQRRLSRCRRARSYLLSSHARQRWSACAIARDDILPPLRNQPGVIGRSGREGHPLLTLDQERRAPQPLQSKSRRWDRAALEVVVRRRHRSARAASQRPWTGERPRARQHRLAESAGDFAVLQRTRR
jgi:hypothetical protein